MFGRSFFRGSSRDGDSQTRKSDWQPRKEVARKMQLGSWRHLTALVIRTGNSVIVYGSKAVADYIVANGKLPVADGQFIEGVTSVSNWAWDNVPISVLAKNIQHIHGRRFKTQGAVGVISD